MSFNSFQLLFPFGYKRCICTYVGSIKCFESSSVENWKITLECDQVVDGENHSFICDFKFYFQFVWLLQQVAKLT